MILINKKAFLTLTILEQNHKPFSWGQKQEIFGFVILLGP